MVPNMDSLWPTQEQVGNRSTESNILISRPFVARAGSDASQGSLRGGRTFIQLRELFSPGQQRPGCQWHVEVCLMELVMFSFICLTLAILVINPIYYGGKKRKWICTQKCTLDLQVLQHHIMISARLLWPPAKKTLKLDHDITSEVADLGKRPKKNHNVNFFQIVLVCLIV